MSDATEPLDVAGILWVAAIDMLPIGDPDRMGEAWSSA